MSLDAPCASFRRSIIVERVVGKAWSVPSPVCPGCRESRRRALPRVVVSSDGPADRVDGVPASWVVAPGTAEEVSGVLRAAAAAGLSIVPSGAGTKLDWGL